jgi:D-lactate dehydrogenase (cytochrome)
LEYFDEQSLGFLRQRYDTVPERAVGAISFEQETTSETEDELMTAWLSLIEQYHALSDKSWFATNEQDQAKLREFRHALPVLMNEWFAKYKQRKVSTDMSVPDDSFFGNAEVLSSLARRRRFALHHLWSHRRQPRARQYSAAQR